jgi:PAS domain S-box-containing protein
VLGALLSFWTASEIKEAAAWRKHSSVVVNVATSLMSEIKDAETGQRGYLLTGDSAYLAPYQGATHKIPLLLSKLRQYVQHHPSQLHKLDALKPAIDEKLAELARTIQVRRDSGMAAALDLVRDGRGSELMDTIRADMYTFISIEQTLWEQRDVNFHSSLRHLIISLIVVSLIVLLLALTTVYYVYRETQRRLENAAHREIQYLFSIQQEANKQLEQAYASLQASEENLAVTLNSIGDAVLSTDAQGNVIRLNPMAEKLTGWSQQEAVGHPVHEVFNIIDEETSKPAFIPVMDTLSKGTIHGLPNHTRLISRSGTQVPVADSCAPIRDRNGQITGAVLIFRDVTHEYAALKTIRDSAARIEEKNAELEKATTVAEQANLAKSMFLSKMSHELRTPLNAILGFTQLLESSTPPPTKVQKDRLNQITKAGWYLLELINEILDLAVIESGKLQLVLEPVLLNEVIQECKSLTEPQAQKRGVSIKYPEFTTPCFVQGDRTRIKQVLINLITNAIKYNREQGVVEVICTAVHPERLRISIMDQGKGLTPEQLTQLFQPFVRLGQSAGPEEGTGIGLVVTKQLVEVMGGTVGVESLVGKGSIFWFELNSGTAEQSAHAGPALSTSASADEHHTVLYIGERNACVGLIREIIEQQPDITLLEAPDGNAGIGLARARYPDVIVLNINQSDIRCFDILKVLRIDPVLAKIPVIMITPYAIPREIEQGVKSGFLLYVTTPIRPGEFISALNKAREFSAEHRA